MKNNDFTAAEIREIIEKLKSDPGFKQKVIEILKVNEAAS